MLFLDLPSDRYFSLPARKSQQLMIAGADTDPGVQAVAQELIARGLCVRTSGPNVLEATMAEPVTGEIGSGKSTASNRLATLHAVALAVLRLRFGSLASTSRRLRRRKVRLGEGTPIDPRALAAVVDAFGRCRTWIDLHDRCLVAAFAVADRLLALGVAPTVVLGVKLGPFAAHAWVQVDGQVLSCTADEARLYTPILTL